jgi:prepilin-type N-terminal cleavage/methylation domain-containing protein
MEKAGRRHGNRSLSRRMSRTSARSPKDRGFTLVETLIVVALIALMSLLAAPWFVKISQRYKVRSAGTDIQTALMAARMTAVRRGANVTVLITTAGPGESHHRIDVDEPAPLQTPAPGTPTRRLRETTFVARDRAVFTALPPANTLIFGPDGGLTNIPVTTPAALITFEGPEQATVKNVLTVETLRTTGRVMVITPNPWN